MLSDLKAYLMKAHRASIDELAIHFAMPPDALRGMLDHWIRKGRIVRVTEGAGKCGSCCACGSKPGEIYRWVSSDAG